MKLIVLHGLPATGKLTIGQHLATLTRFKLFHNHLVVDALLSVFEFGSPDFVELRESLWLSVIERAARGGLPGLIFTFAPETTVRDSFVPALIEATRAAGGSPIFVELACPIDEIRVRLGHPSRQQHGKLTSREVFDSLHRAGAFAGPPMPKADLVIDTHRHDPAAAAGMIKDFLGGP